MSTFFIMIFSVLAVVMFNIMQIRNHPSRILRGVCSVLFIIIGLRYISLIVFTLSTNLNFLKFFLIFIMVHLRELRFVQSLHCGILFLVLGKR